MGNDLRTGYKAAGASFVSVGKTGCNLTDIIPQGADKFTGNVSIQVLNYQGKMEASYKFYKGYGRRPYADDGWYYGSTLITKDNDVNFPAGTGLWFSGADGLSFQTSGEVLLDSVQCNLRDGYILLANPFATDAKLTSLVPGGAEKFQGNVSIQILNYQGKMEASYKFYKGYGRRPYMDDGWYYGTTLITKDKDVSFKAGDGLWVAGADGLTLTFTTPFEDAE